VAKEQLDALTCRCAGAARALSFELLLDDPSDDPL
jgi:hypothetical protein